jgi:hypothetical protein
LVHCTKSNPATLPKPFFIFFRLIFLLTSRKRTFSEAEKFRLKQTKRLYANKTKQNKTNLSGERYREKNEKLWNKSAFSFFLLLAQKLHSMETVKTLSSEFVSLILGPML